MLYCCEMAASRACSTPSTMALAYLDIFSCRLSLSDSAQRTARRAQGLQVQHVQVSQNLRPIHLGMSLCKLHQKRRKGPHICEEQRETPGHLRSLVSGAQQGRSSTCAGPQEEAGANPSAFRFGSELLREVRSPPWLPSTVGDLMASVNSAVSNIWSSVCWLCRPRKVSFQFRTCSAC